MFRYVALIWDPQDAQQADAAQAATRRLRASSSQWQEVLRSETARPVHGHPARLARTACATRRCWHCPRLAVRVQVRSRRRHASTGVQAG